MAGESLKDFLISLGFNVDDASYTKMLGAIGGVTKSVFSLGAVVVGATAAVETMVETVARQMQDLYYSAQRTSVAAQALQNVGFAAKQLGMDAQNGQDLFEGFARSVRINPGTQTLAASLGGQFQTVNGQIGLTQKGLFNILETLAKLPRYQALLYAPMLGFDPDSLNNVLNNLPVFEQRADAAAQMAKDFGLNLDEASSKGAAFSQQVGTLGQKLEDLGERVFTDIEPGMAKLVDLTSQAVTAFGKWSNTLGGIPTDILAVTAALGGVAKILQLLGKIPGFAWLASMGVRVGGLGAAGVLTGLTYGLYQAVKPSPTNEGEEAYMRAHPELYPGMAKTPAAPPESPGLMSRFSSWIKSKTGIELYHPSAPAEEALPASTGPQSRVEQAVRYFMSQGWTREQAIGMVGNLQGEDSNLDPLAQNQGAFGIAQWRGPRLEALKKFAEQQGTPYTDFKTQLAFMQHELESTEPYAALQIKQASTRRQAAEDASLYYERAPGGYPEALRRAQLAANINLNQHTEITVNGARDPNQTAAKVREAQTGVNDEMARAFSNQYR